MTKKRVLAIAGTLAGVLALGVVGFAIGRQAGGDDGSPPAAAAGTPAAPAAAATPAPGTATATPQAPAGVDPYTGLPLDPDTSKPHWFVPYMDAELKFPYFEGVVAGITISYQWALDAGRDEKADPCAPYRHAYDLEAARGSKVEIRRPTARPFLEADTVSVIICNDGTPVAAEASFEYPSDPARKIYGGNFVVTRYVTERPVISPFWRAHRVKEVVVAGRPAAMAVSPLPHLEFGLSGLAAYHDGVLTQIYAFNLTERDLLAVAEELLR
jgi:hypothetical protein